MPVTASPLPKAFPPGRYVLTVDEVASYLGSTDQHVLNLIDAGRIGAIDVGNRSKHFYRIPIAELERYISKRSTV